MSTKYLRKNHVIATVTTNDGITEVTHAVYDSINAAKRASRKLGLGVVQNVPKLPAQQTS